MAVGGSLFVKETLIANCRFDEIGDLKREPLKVLKKVPK
jgi:hypothetical protein